MDPEHADDQADELRNAMERLQVLEALVAAAARRDEVVELVGRAQNASDAVRAVQDLLQVNETPAAAVLDCELRYFTVEQRQKLLGMREELRTQLERPR